MFDLSFAKPLLKLDYKFLVNKFGSTFLKGGNKIEILFQCKIKDILNTPQTSF
jgi:hypothetical protein